MNDVSRNLSDIISKVGELKEIQERSKYFSGDFLIANFYKSSEDGILENIHNANKHQLEVMLSSYKWKYYTNYNDPKELSLEILKRVRDKKIENICGLS